MLKEIQEMFKDNLAFEVSENINKEIVLTYTRGNKRIQKIIDPYLLYMTPLNVDVIVRMSVEAMIYEMNRGGN